MKYPKISKQQQAALGAAAGAVLIGILLYCLINTMRSRKKDSSTRIPTIHSNTDRPSLRSRPRRSGKEPRHAPWHFGDDRDGINASGLGGQGFKGPPPPGLNGFKGPPPPGLNGFKGPRSSRKGFERPYNIGYSYDFY